MQTGSKVLFMLPPETAHRLSIAALKSGLVASRPIKKDKRLVCKIAGLDFPNPVGLAAGYDKNGEVVDAILKLGFGFTETGTVTPQAQAGNPRPRLFRLSEDQAVINRLGFNNAGHAAMAGRLAARGEKSGVVGVNIGANKDADDFVTDYVKGIEAFYETAAYFTINISSPNTPGLRELQTGKALNDLLSRVLDKADALGSRTNSNKPVFLKIAPDLDLKQLDEIVSAVKRSRLDGLVISNTTVDRHDLRNRKFHGETGGLSGKPLFNKSTKLLAEARLRLGPELPIIGVGGVDSAQTAIAKLQAGASLVQLYTGMIYKGPGLVQEIIRGIQTHMDSNNIGHVSDLSGTQTDTWCRNQ